jgi:hypothetical protein
MSSPSFFFERISGLRLIGKISRLGVLYLDFSEHLEQYNNGGDGVAAEDDKYIHFANLLSLMHVRFGADGSCDSAVCVFERLGSNRRSMTSHLSIFIW